MRQLVDYFREAQGYSCVQREEGFATYCITGDTVYLRDIWVEPDFRKSGIAKEMADEVARIGKKAGCKFMTGSVDTTSPTCTQSLKVLLAYGMEVAGLAGTGIYFRKEI